MTDLFFTEEELQQLLAELGLKASRAKKGEWGILESIQFETSELNKILSQKIAEKGIKFLLTKIDEGCYIEAETRKEPTHTGILIDVKEIEK